LMGGGPRVMQDVCVAEPARGVLVKVQIRVY
jgi:hypothetical protein